MGRHRDRLTWRLLCFHQVDVGSLGHQRVGYVANLHTQAYQDRDPIIYEVGGVYVIRRSFSSSIRLLQTTQVDI